MIQFYFENLEVYQKAVEFSFVVYKKTKNWPNIYQFNLCDQIRRASLSVALNIAEGSSRTKMENKRFLSISRGSCFECIPLIEMSYKLKLLSTDEKNKWYNSCVSLAKMLSKLRSKIT